MNDESRKTVIIGGTEKRDIVIVDYDPQWPRQFQSHAQAIAAALGRAALRIEHIGSASVPELAAKPIIDILLVVKESANESSYLPMMESARYVLRVREPDFHEHRMFRTPEKDVHIHVFTIGSSEITRVLMFRDRLRSNANDRLRYEQTKRKLASQSWPHMDAYAKAKTEVIESIIAAASI
jgi:GrpB-like predicted nucleotidyltransferase (UPF0157 family)